MTTAKGYTEMKDSGIQWIGQIPTHWLLKKAKYCVSITNGSDPKSEGSVPVYGSGSESFKTCGEYKEGPAVLIGRKGATLHIPHYIEGRYWNVDTAFDVKPQEGFSLRYYYYLACVFDYNYYISQTTLPGMTQTNYNNMKLPCPSLDEQTAIASYLDAQCAKIDEIIAQAKASMEDYKQWKASIIYEAVTKGLDPNVEMKDSGIPCVDKVPKHWTVTRFGKIAAVKSNLVNPKDYQSYKQISPENIEKGSGVLLDCVTVEESGVISGNHLFYKGQILYSKIRPTLNKVIIAPFDGLCSADMYPIDTDHCSRFILYLMLSAYFNEQVALVTGNRVKMPKINQNELSQIMVAIPSDTEEQQIAKYLDLSCSQIDVLIKEKQSLIDDLESYKKSLIYEVVTGKRRV